MKKFSVLAISVIILVSVFACQPGGGDPSSTAGAVSLNFNTRNLIVDGDPVTLIATVADSVTDKAVTWKTSDPAIATLGTPTVVSGKPRVAVTGVSGGTATITVTLTENGDTAECVFTVRQPVLPASVSVDPSSLSTYTGKQRQLAAAILPENADNKNVTWTSSNTSVATVSDTGLVVTLTEGTTTITATTVAGGKTGTCAITVGPRPVGVVLGDKDGLSGKSAGQYFDDMGLNLGWNMGNSFDGSPMETSWGNPAPTKVMFQGVKDAGFNVVRIPITWHTTGHPIGPAPTYTLNADYLTRVAAAVDMAFEVGLVVIINIHHDDNSWLSIKKAGDDFTAKTGDYKTITDQFRAVWTQIADKFKDYGDWLIFEGFNEVHNHVQGAGAWGWNAPAYEFDIIDYWNQVFTDAVRAAGGKNTERFLVIQPLCARFERVFDGSKFTLPTDTVPTTGAKQIVSVHFYYPEAFSLNGTSTSWSYNFDTEFGKSKTKFANNNIPVIIGECGATYQSNRTGSEKTTADANRITYMQTLGSKAVANGMVPILWDNGANTRSSTAGNPNGETFGLFNRTTGNPHPEQEAVIQAIVDAVNGD